MVLVVFQLYSVCHFGKLVNFGLGSVRSERVKRARKEGDIERPYL